MKRVVSISLGSSVRNKTTELALLGQQFRIERIGTDGSLDRFADLFSSLDGHVDAFGIGGADLFLHTADRRYTFRRVAHLVRGATVTPVVDGSGLKNSLERECICRLQQNGQIDFSDSNVLLVCGLDRFGMAQELDRLSKAVVYGDCLFGVDLHWPIKSYRALSFVGKIGLPILTRLPQQWFYPTGGQQQQQTPKYKRWFDWADVIAGDWHYIRRYMPESLPGKTIITQTLRKDDFTFLKQAGIRRVVTTTPVTEGETFATNVWEAMIVAFHYKTPEEITPDDYLSVLDHFTWPNVIDL